jgi:HEAT repeat protein
MKNEIDELHQIELLDPQNANDLLLLLKLSYSPDGIVRSEALDKLASYNTKEALSRLKAALSDINELVRVSALEGIAHLGSESDFNTIVSMLDDESWLVQEAAVFALGKIGNPVAISILHKRLSDSEYTDHAPIEGALYELGELNMQERIVQHLEHEDEFERNRAVNVLAHIANEKNVSTVKAAIAAARDKETNSRLRNRMDDVIHELNSIK